MSKFEREIATLHLPPSETGHVYVVGFGKFIKIGWSATARRRLASLQQALPVPLTIYALTPGTLETEREFHSRFEDHRLNGEWFALRGDVQVWTERGCP